MVLGVLGLGLRVQGFRVLGVEPEVVVSIGGPQYRPQTTIILLTGSQKGTPNFGNPQMICNG